VVWTPTPHGDIAALDANTGEPIWQTRITNQLGAFVWSSPLLSGDSLYVGIASIGDCPEATGRIVRIEPRNGAVRAELSLVPPSCDGAGVWGSISVIDGRLFLATGNSLHCLQAEPYAEAVVELDPGTLQIRQSWQSPLTGSVQHDRDFGSTPVRLTTAMSGRSRDLIAVTSKDGNLYLLDRRAIAAGPVSTIHLANPEDRPEIGGGSISSAFWDGKTLFAAGGAYGAGRTCKGSVLRVGPEMETPQWRDCLDGPVLAALVGGHGRVFVAGGRSLYLVGDDGRIVWKVTFGSAIYCPPTLAQGGFIIADSSGEVRLYSY